MSELDYTGEIDYLIIGIQRDTNFNIIKKVAFIIISSGSAASR